jgi:hypothetical protein
MLFDVTDLEQAADVHTVLACIKFPPPLIAGRTAGTGRRVAATCKRLEDYGFQSSGAGSPDQGGSGSGSGSGPGSWLDILRPTVPAHLLKEQHKLYERMTTMIRKHALCVAGAASIVLVWGPCGAGKTTALRLAAREHRKRLVELDLDLGHSMHDVRAGLMSPGLVLLVRSTPELLAYARAEQNTLFSSMLFILSDCEPWTHKELPTLQLDPVTFWPESTQKGWRKNRELVQVLARRLVQVWPEETGEAVSERKRLARVTTWLRTRLDCFPDFRRLLVHGQVEHGQEYANGPSLPQAPVPQPPVPEPRLPQARLPGSDKELFRAVFCAGGLRGAPGQTTLCRDVLRCVDDVGESLERVVHLNALASCDSAARDFLRPLRDDADYLERASGLLDALCDLDLVALEHPESRACFRVALFARGCDVAAQAGLAAQVFSERRFCADIFTSSSPSSSQPSPLTQEQLERRGNLGLELELR